MASLAADALPPAADTPKGDLPPKKKQKV